MRILSQTAFFGLAASLWAMDATDAACSRTETALTTECNNMCYEGRPCIAYADGETCTPTTFSSCTNDSSCTYECFKNGVDDFVENGVVAYTSYVFLIPYGQSVSAKEASWSSDKEAAADAALTLNETNKYPSKSADVLKAIEPLDFETTTVKVTISGGVSLQSVRGRTATIDLKSQFLDGETQLKSVTLANLGLGTIPQSSFPSQLTNLTLSNCLLKNYPEDLTSMTSLVYLDLSKNYLSDFPVKFSLRQLEALNLSTNTLESFEGNFPNLTTLDLSSNTLTTIPDKVFEMTELRQLYLSKNSFTDVSFSPDQITFLQGLSLLSVDSFGTLTCAKSGQIDVGGVAVCQTGLGSSFSSGSGATTDGSSGSSNTGAIVGGVIGGLIAVAIVVALFLCYQRRHRGEEKHHSHTTSGIAGSTLSGGTETQSLWNDQELLSLQVNMDDIEIVRKIGNGAYGIVYLARYRKNRLVACKRLKKDEVTWQNTQHFIAEIKLVSKLDHPRIVQLVGVAWTIESDLQALFEYMENGDLRTYLEASSTPRNWTADKIQIAIDVVEALVYVHSFTLPLVHRDLKSRNVLLSGDMRASLSDFGVARFRSEVNTMTTGVGTGRWLAPEVIVGSNDYDQSCDIFSFGVVLSEIDTHNLPYEDVRGTSGNRLADVAILQMVASGTLLPTFSGTCPIDILHLAKRCMALNRKDRPTAVEVAFALRNVQKTNDFYVV